MNFLPRLVNQLNCVSLKEVFTKRWATKKSGGSKARQKHKPDGKRLGLKKYPGEFVGRGNIIVKQRGTKNHPGRNVGIGRDHTIYALIPGYVHMTEEGGRNYINVVEFPPNLKSYTTKHSEAFRSALQYGWRNETVYSRDQNGLRIFNHYNLAMLPEVKPSCLSAVTFSSMEAYFHGMGISLQNSPLNTPSSDVYQFKGRIQYQSLGRNKRIKSLGMQYWSGTSARVSRNKKKKIKVFYRIRDTLERAKLKNDTKSIKELQAELQKYGYKIKN